MTATTWTELAHRAQVATGPHRDLDGSIAALVYGVDPYEAIDVDLEVFVSGEFLPVPRWSASVDAVLALIAEKLPADWAWTCGQNIHHRQWVVSINALDDAGSPHSVAWGQSQHTPALALLAAFCLATDAAT